MNNYAHYIEGSYQTNYMGGSYDKIQHVVIMDWT